MDTKALSPETIEERVIWYTIRFTFGFYLIGALYIVAPVMAWLMVMLLFKRLLFQSCGRRPLWLSNGIPIAIQLWCIAMLVMLLSLIVAHFDYQLGYPLLIKSTIGWAKGWALLAIFPLLGCLQIRPEIIYRACMHVALHICLLLPLFVFAWLANLPQTLYVSPLKIVGGPGVEFFSVSLYEIDPGTGAPRWRLFTPWAPALGFVANIFFIFALQEREKLWRWVGIVASLLMMIMSGSRLAIVAVIVVWSCSGFLQYLHRPSAPFVAGIMAYFFGASGVFLYDTAERFWQAFRSARAGSTRVREALGRIALDRWSSEAPIWGHGVVERGPHLVEFMPIGSHHSWYGLLFVKGAVGAAALALPMIFSFFQLIMWTDRLPIARVGVAMLLLLLLYTFGENLEILAYLVWPALMIIGIAHREIHRIKVPTESMNTVSLKGEKNYA